jgi:REP element-mobilizing transposase RayT
MARPARIEIADGLYHVTSRAIDGCHLYRDPHDRQAHLAALARVIGRFHWRCLAYCLMGTHYHLLIRTPIPNLARAMRELNGTYAQGFNARHDRNGHLFGGRYKAILVQDDSHAVQAAAYTFRNPVAAGLCEAAEHWRWSSYPATLGLARVPPFLDTQALLELLSPDPDRARALLREAVDRASAPETSPLPADGSALHGDAGFVGRHLALVEPHPEVPRNGWQAPRPSLAELLADPTGDAMLVAYRGHGYLLREIADHLGRHYSTVSKRLREAEAEARAERRAVRQRKT